MRRIGVRDSASAIVAGMSGTEQATSGALPMMWAGAKANTDDGVGGAAFRVYNNGHVDMGDVSISQGDSSKKLTIANGAATSLNGSKKSVFTSDVMSSISSAVSQSAKTTTKTVAAGRKNLYIERVETTNLQATSISEGNTVTLATYTPSKSASLTLPAFSFEFFVDTDDASQGGEKFKNDSWIESSMTLILSVGGTKKVLTSATLRDYHSSEASSSTSLSVSAQTIVAPASAAISLYVQFSVKGQILPWERYELTSQDDGTMDWFPYEDAGTENTVYIKFPSAVSMTITEGEYRNTYYADGFFLQSASTKYAGINTFDSSTLMQMRSGNAILKFTADGLLQSLNGTTFFRVNQIIYAVFVECLTSGYQIRESCNPLGLAIDSITTDGTGKITVTHKLGRSSYLPIAQAWETSKLLFAQVQAKTATSVTVWRVDRNGSLYDGAFWLYLIDTKTY